MTVMVCSAHCAEEARSNYQYKVDNNIKPGTPILEEKQEETDTII